MMNAERPQPNEISRERKKLMAEFGITHFLMDNFHYRGYRYTNFDDAAAQAKHDLAK
jgi:hypothetical protein